MRGKGVKFPSHKGLGRGPKGPDISYGHRQRGPFGPLWTSLRLGKIGSFFFLGNLTVQGSFYLGLRPFGPKGGEHPFGREFFLGREKRPSLDGLFQAPSGPENSNSSNSSFFTFFFEKREDRSGVNPASRGGP